MAKQIDITTRAGASFTMRLNDSITPADLHDLAAQIHREAVRMQARLGLPSPAVVAPEPVKPKPTGFKGWVAKWVQS